MINGIESFWEIKINAYHMISIFIRFDKFVYQYC